MAWKPWHKPGWKISTGERCLPYAYNDETDQLKVRITAPGRSSSADPDDRDEIIAISDFHAGDTPPPR